MHQTVHIFLLAFLLLVSNFEPIYFDDWHITLTENPKPEIVQEVAYDPWGLVMQDESYFKPEMGVTPPSGAGGLLLFNGKELQTYADLHLYDYHWRQYDPQLGRWHSPDPADQFHGLSGYAYCANNPVMYIDPDGREIITAIIIGALIGGAINLGVKAYQGKITDFTSGLKAFGIGALAGGIGVATGGAAFAAAGGAAAGAGGFLAGAMGGVIGGYYQSMILGIGNMAFFGDPFSPTDAIVGAAFGAITGGVSNGISSVVNGKSFWNGVPKINTPSGVKLQIATMQGKSEARLNMEIKRPEIDIPVETPAHPVVSNNGNFHQPSTNGLKLGGDLSGKIITNNSSKLLNQYNSVESMLGSVQDFQQLKGGVLQGSLRGNGESIFGAISQQGTRLSSGAIQLPNGTVLFKYFSSTTQEFSIFIKHAGQNFKIRINP